MSHKVNGNDTFNGHFKHAFPSGYDLFSQLLIRTGLKKKKKRQISTTYSNISYQHCTIDVSVVFPVYIKNFNCLWYLFKFISKNFIFQFLEALIAKKIQLPLFILNMKEKTVYNPLYECKIEPPFSDTFLRHSLLTSNTGRRFTASTKKSWILRASPIFR